MHGEQRTDVWMNYIRFEYEHDLVGNMDVIKSRAERVLTGELLSIFTRQYSVFEGSRHEQKLVLKQCDE